MKEPAGVISVTTNGHTYQGSALHPPGLTLFQRDPTAEVLGGAFVFGGLLVGWIELIYRLRRESKERGVAAIIVGSLLVMFSLFGLIVGVASIGLVGALLIWSGVSSSKRQHPPTSDPNPGNTIGISS